MRYRITASGSSGSRAPETMMTVGVPGYRIADFSSERFLESESADVFPGRCLGSESAIFVQEDTRGANLLILVPGILPENGPGADRYETAGQVAAAWAGKRG